ncbi:MAG: hypothetical protein MJE68_20865 [Proteobacteria bacterium]|nr:hypothetical protein [Pseudomonadota bacterium]
MPVKYLQGPCLQKRACSPKKEGPLPSKKALANRKRSLCKRPPLPKPGWQAKGGAAFSAAPHPPPGR